MFKSFNPEISSDSQLLKLKLMLHLRLFDAEITCQQASGLSYSYNNAYYCVKFASQIRNAQLTYFSEAEVFRWPVATDFWLPVGVPLLFSWPLPLLQLSVWSALQQYCTCLSALNPDPAVNHNTSGYKRKTFNTKNYATVSRYYRHLFELCSQCVNAISLFLCDVGACGGIESLFFQQSYIAFQLQEPSCGVTQF